jgi:hypothetical protein
MAEFFKTSVIWVVDYRYKGQPRRWFRSFGPGVDVQQRMRSELQQLYGDHVQTVEVRRATEAEETQYLRGEAPPNVFCATGRRGNTSEGP